MRLRFLIAAFVWLWSSCADAQPSPSGTTPTSNDLFQFYRAGTPMFATIGTLPLFSSGAPAVGCTVGSLLWVDPSTGKLACDGTFTYVPGFVQDINGPSFSGLVGKFQLSQVGNLQSTGFAPTIVGSCTITAFHGSILSGDFTAMGPCSGGTIEFDTISTAATGYACKATNLTAIAAAAGRPVEQTLPLATNSATFKATMSDMDLVTFLCIGH